MPTLQIAAAETVCSSLGLSIVFARERRLRGQQHLSKLTPRIMQTTGRPNVPGARSAEKTACSPDHAMLTAATCP